MTPTGDRTGAATRDRFGFAMLVAACGVLAVTAAAWGGAWWWLLDLVANLRVQLVVLSGALVVLAVVTRRWRAATVAAAALVVGLVAVVPVLWLGGPAAPMGEDPSRLTVAHVNMQGVAGDLDRFRAWVADSGADVVVVLEPSPIWVGELGREPAALPVAWWDRLEPVPRVLVLSGVPLSDPATPHGGGLADATVTFTVDLGPRQVDVLVTHVASPTSGSRTAQRDRELRAVGRWVAERPGPVVVAGDLNATPFSHAFRGLVARTSLVDTGRGAGWAPTWPVGLPPAQLPIDHALHDPSLTTTRRTVGPSFGAAHETLTVTYAAAEPG